MPLTGFFYSAHSKVTIFPNYPEKRFYLLVDKQSNVCIMITVLLYNVQCTVYSVCTLYSVQCTVYSVCTVLGAVAALFLPNAIPKGFSVGELSNNNIVSKP